jgi:hypothetical protein
VKVYRIVENDPPQKGYTLERRWLFWFWIPTIVQKPTYDEARDWAHARGGRVWNDMRGLDE